MRIQCVGAALILAVTAVEVPSASDPVAVYAKIDRVVLEPDERAPIAIQVWGVFSIASADRGDDYQPAARGYLYYRAQDNQALARREWADLKQVAGTGQIVAFGSRWSGRPTLRQPGSQPADPDVYTTNVGLTKISGRTEYPPVRSLLAFNQ
jgi:hypothetical protein